jgi:NAD(P)H-flavin reductase/ferredoxin
LKFNNSSFQPQANESVLDCLLRHGQDVDFSCKSGSCQACLLKALKGDVDTDAQRGLKVTAIEQGHFLACQQPAQSIELACKIDEHALFGSARLVEKYLYNDEICRIRLEPSCSLFYHAGQFVNLKNAQGVSRSYSMASLPSEDAYLEFHIRRKVQGEMSNWIFDTFKEGDFIDIQGPLGECFYTPDSPLNTLLLIGSGTGAAPLIGIARDAIRSQHKGDIHFYHGAREAQYLYLHEILNDLQTMVPNFFYHPCTSEKEVSSDIHYGSCNEIALNEMYQPKTTQLYLCGNPQMVMRTSKKAFLDGVSIKNIYTDPFEYKDKRKTPR